MVFWSLQSKAVVEKSKKNGIFHPDFSFSSQQHIADYNRVLNAFNKLNSTNCKGLIFCLAPEQSPSQANEYENVDMVKALFHYNSNIRGSLASEPYSLFDENHVLLKINGSDFETINTVPIDYWNHILVMDGGSPEFFYNVNCFSNFHVDIAPFTDMQQWYSQTYLSGYKLNGNSFGISLHLRSNGFRSIIWEGNHDVRRVGDMLKSQPELQKVFSGHRDGDDAWSYPEIIPFDSVIDWLKNLQELLKRLQFSNQ